MSLDVNLEFECTEPVYASEQIFIREGGSTKAITREEWDRRFPDREPIVVPATLKESDRTRNVYWANITHNLNAMASEAGIYKHLWRPDEIGIDKAKELIQPLTDGLAALNTNPERFKKFNPSNGWGTYEGLVEFVKEYLCACIRYPEARVSVSR